MKFNHLVLKILIFTLGLFVMAFGVALSVKANLGVSPISCIPYVFSLKIAYTLGQLTILFNILLILFQIALLRKKYRLIQLVQLPVVFVFGFFIDLTLHMVSGINATNYIWQTFWCLLSCVVIALGVFLEVKANVTYLPGEGLAMAISQTFKKEFGKAKIGVDSGMVIVGIISSLLFSHKVEGIREGTIVAAILVGFIAKFFSTRLKIIDVWLSPNMAKTANLETVPNKPIKNLVITISREYGSGGHEIGQYVAKKLGLPFYDKNIITLTAKQGGFTSEYIQQNEQKLAHALLFELYEQNYAYVNEQCPPLDALFLVQSKIIRNICAKESCVIVGRCANFILKDNPNSFNVFIHANSQYRKKKIADEYGLKTIVTDKDLEKTDRERANYCLHFTGKNWNDASNYHLTIDSSTYKSEEVAQLIINAVNKRGT
ncbi:DUF6198 family protein [Geofilum sp. OHC36d9]|uniref:DUF6198 family protein n=1 Tax=Geofilum sp. OHC36d9 TaxID=3458413 RepID=UPI0040343E2D